MVELDGHNLTPQLALRVILDEEKVRISAEALAQVAAGADRLAHLVEQGTQLYGVTTGFGKLSRVTVSPDEYGALQENIVRSHACGVGAPLSEEAVRGMLLFRLNSLLTGLSGIRPQVVELLGEMLNRGVYPVIPEQGSVGASGDLVPLAHLALVLLGEGRAWYLGEELPGGEALRRAGLEPLAGLAPKEGLALLNGTAYMLSLTTLAWGLGWRAFRAALLASSLTFQALRGSTTPLDERLHQARPHPGQLKVAAWLRELLSGTKLCDTWQGDVQDPYSLRCLPQLLGPCLENLWWVEEKLRVEMNSATDNPLIFPQGDALPGGNFHGQILAFAAESLALALAELGASCERRISLLMTAEDRGLPPFLSPEAGPSSGLMLLQYTAAALAAENKVLCHPAAVDSLPTSGGKEDHNSMGATSAWKVLRIAENVIWQVALELTCARWAVELVGPEGLSPATRPSFRQLAQLVPPPGPDRFMGEAIARVRAAIRAGEVQADVV
jgi:histidine ammonia-lyase